MYAVFDKFLATDTWFKGHPCDETRFYQALSQVVRHPDFSSQDMAAYFRAKLNIANDDTFVREMSNLVSMADTICDFLKVEAAASEVKGKRAT